METSNKVVRRVLIGASIVTVIGIGATALMYTRTTAPKDNVIMDALNTRIEIVPGVSIDGVALGGKTREEAEAILEQQKPHRLSQVIIENGEKQATLDLSAIVPTEDTQTTLDQAMDYGNGADPKLREVQRNQAASQGVNFDIKNEYDISILRDRIANIATEISIDPVNAEAKVRGKENPEAKLTTQEDASEAIDSVDSTQEEEEVAEIIQAKSPITVDENGNVQGIDSIFEYVEAIPGKKVDATALYDQIQTTINAGVVDNEVITAQTEDVPAEKNIQDVQQKFELISTATSNFNGSYSKKNRVFNINKAAEIINGYVLAPGESFSFNSVLGPRTEKTGWKAAGAISEGKSVQETGGGICQVSSTAYTAVLKADLQVDERHPHSWPLSYLPTGQDATISTGGPDFVFTNNYEKPIVMIAQVNLNNNSLTVQFYGEPKPDFTEIRLTSKKVATIPQPATQYTSDASKARSGRAGSRWETYKEYYSGDELVKTELSHTSTYRAIAALSTGRTSSTTKQSNQTTTTQQTQEAAPVVEVAPATEAPAAAAPEPEKEVSSSQLEELIPVE